MGSELCCLCGECESFSIMLSPGCCLMAPCAVTSLQALVTVPQKSCLSHPCQIKKFDGSYMYTAVLLQQMDLITSHFVPFLPIILTPWSTLLVTGIQLDFAPLITTFWAWLLSQLSIHQVFLSTSPYYSFFFFFFQMEVSCVACPFLPLYVLLPLVCALKVCCCCTLCFFFFFFSRP